MIQVGNLGDGQAGRIEAILPTGRAWSGDILRTRDGALTPHAFFVHQDPNVVLDRHYHDAAEFQVIVGGSGKLGTHAVRPFSIHYASCQAVYGPLVADASGLDYVTCRIIYQRGLFKFPDERKRMARGRRTQIMGSAAYGDPSSLAAAQIEDVICPDGDGLAAWIMRLPPGTMLEPPRHGGGAGRFLLLTSGSASVGTEAFETLSVGWIGNREAAVTAGPNGAEMIVLQLPREALNDAETKSGKSLDEPQGEPVQQ